MRLRLATYNVHRCVGSDGRYDPERILGVLRELDADIIALQEVERRPWRGCDVLSWLGEKAGYATVAGPTLLREVHHYGNALLTRARLLHARRIDLSVPGREPRGAIDADLDWKGVPVQLVATHLGLKPAERRAQTLRLLDLFTPSDDRVAVLLGDLNEWFLWGRPLRWLRLLFGRTPEPRTFPARWPLFALDRIWVQPASSLRAVAAHRTALARLASDHLPLKAAVELAPAVR